MLEGLATPAGVIRPNGTDDVTAMSSVSPRGQNTGENAASETGIIKLWSFALFRKQSSVGHTNWGTWPDTRGTVSRTPRAHKRTFPVGPTKNASAGKVRGKQEAAAAEPLVLTF